MIKTSDFTRRFDALARSESTIPLWASLPEIDILVDTNLFNENATKFCCDYSSQLPTITDYYCAQVKTGSKDPSVVTNTRLLFEANFDKEAFLKLSNYPITQSPAFIVSGRLPKVIMETWACIAFTKLFLPILVEIKVKLHDVHGIENVPLSIIFCVLEECLNNYFPFGFNWIKTQIEVLLKSNGFAGKPYDDYENLAHVWLEGISQISLNPFSHLDMTQITTITQDAFFNRVGFVKTQMNMTTPGPMY